MDLGPPNWQAVSVVATAEGEGEGAYILCAYNDKRSCMCVDYISIKLLLNILSV